MLLEALRALGSGAAARHRALWRDVLDRAAGLAAGHRLAFADAAALAFSFARADSLPRSPGDMIEATFRHKF